jgi:hypothetical protein
MRVDLSDFKRFRASWNSKMKRSIPIALNKSGNKVREIILDRTSRGVGLSGRFKRYSREYADYRKDKGRGPTPDLNFSGRMLSNIDVEKVSTNKVLVNFKRKEEQKKAMQNQKSRPFFGVRPQEEKFVAEAFARQLRKDLR